MRINFTQEQRAWAGTKARAQVAYSRSHGRTERFGAQDFDRVERNRIAILGELAVALYTGSRWTWEIGPYGGADVGGFYQVRATAYRRGRLIVHDDDHDDEPYILVIVESDHAVLAGWLYGRDAKRLGKAETYRNGGEALYVERRDLLPIADLPRP